MSNTTVIYPMVAALAKAEEILGPQPNWRAVNETQELFLKEFFAPCHAESSSIAEIESIVSFAADEINRFLQERGFTLQLGPFAPDTFGVASVLDLLVKWFRLGSETMLMGQEKQLYPAIHQGTGVSTFYQSERHGSPIVQLRTTSDDLVYLTRLDNPLTGFELLHYAQALAAALKPSFDYGSVTFPMIDLKQRVDSGWLIGMRATTGKQAEITQALQETHLAMNEQGARAKSAVAIGMQFSSLTLPKPELLIDTPFLIWFQRPGLRVLLFVGYMTEEDWKKPATLSMVNAGDDAPRS